MYLIAKTETRPLHNNSKARANINPRIFELVKTSVQIVQNVEL